MVNEQEKTLDALQIAIQMEIDGKEYYLKAGQDSTNEMGEKLFQSLAKAEDTHRQKFAEIYESIRNDKSWPMIIFPPDSGKTLRTVFALARKESADGIKLLDTELDAVQAAMGMENKTLDFYKGQEAKAGDATEKGFYEALAAEEREHYLILLDYYEFLKNPAGWFVKSEHSSLDGG
ncbi:ferritin family protein [Chloroflexota bacterium]